MKTKTAITLSISKRLLKEIEEDTEGKNRSDKIVKCAELGYKLLTEAKK